MIIVRFWKIAHEFVTIFRKQKKLRIKVFGTKFKKIFHLQAKKRAAHKLTKVPVLTQTLVHNFVLRATSKTYFANSSTRLLHERMLEKDDIS